MRADEPVWYDQAARAWNVSRYDDVARVLGDARTFSSDFGRAFPDRADLAEGNIVAMDPPRHDQLRGLVGQAFTPAAWADALLEQGSTRPDDAAVDLIRERLKKFHDYLRAHVAWRRARSSGDLLSDLVDAEIDDVHLTDAEIVGFATILLLAGHVTTTLLLGNIALALDERPHVQALLRAQPARIPAAIEEILRYRSPVPWTARVTTTEVRIGDQVIPAEHMVRVSLASAGACIIALAHHSRGWRRVWRWKRCCDDSRRSASIQLNVLSTTRGSTARDRYTCG